MKSPTELSLAYLRSKGWHACIVEKFNSYAMVRQDAFGFGDILCFGRDEETGIMHTALVQTTTSNNLGNRRQKVLRIKIADEWTKAGNWIILHGWKKPKKGFEPEVIEEIYGMNGKE